LWVTQSGSGKWVVDIDRLFMIKFYRPRGQVIPAFPVPMKKVLDLEIRINLLF